MRAILFSSMIFGLAACGGGGSPSGAPDGPKFASIRGYEYDDNVVKMSSGELLWAETILKDYKKKRRSSGDVVLKTLTQTGCKLPRLTPNEHAIQTVTIEESHLDSPIYVLDDEMYKEGVAQLIKRYKETGRIVGLGPQYSRPTAVGLVNVVVTETSKPVFLVLSARRQTLWNIHPAEGVTIDKIVILSNEPNGLANVPDGAEVFALMGEKATERCKIIPARRPEDHWDLMEGYTRNSTSYKADRVRESIKAGNAFYNVLDRNYDVRDYGIIDASRLSHVLVGPKPDKKVTYQSLNNATIYWPKVPHLLTAPSHKAHNPRPIGEAYIVAQVKKQADGNFKNLLRQ